MIQVQMSLAESQKRFLMLKHADIEARHVYLPKAHLVVPPLIPAKLDLETRLDSFDLRSRPLPLMTAHSGRNPSGQVQSNVP